MFLLQSAADRTPWNYVHGPDGWMVFPALHYPRIALREDTLEELEAFKGWIVRQAWGDLPTGTSTYERIML